MFNPTSSELTGSTGETRTSYFSKKSRICSRKAYRSNIGVDDVFDCDEILYRKRNAAKGPELLTLHHTVFGLLGGRQGFLGHQRAEGIQRLLRRFGGLQGALGDLHRRQFFFDDPLPHLDGGHAT